MNDKNIDNEFNGDDEFEFANLISRQLSNPQAMLSFSQKVLKNAEEGDTASLKMIQQAMKDIKYQKNKKQIVTDEQLKTIIGLTADRIRTKEQVKSS